MTKVLCVFSDLVDDFEFARNYHSIIVFDYERLSLLEKKGFKNIRLFSSLDCDPQSVAREMEEISRVTSDLTSKLVIKLTADREYAVPSDLFEFDVQKISRFMLNIKVALKEFLKVISCTAFYVDVAKDDEFGALCVEMTADSEIQVYFLKDVGRERARVSHLDFSTTKDIQNIHNINQSSARIWKNIFIKFGNIRWIQKVYIRSFVFRLIIFSIFKLSNFFKDLFFSKSEQAIFVCYDKWTSNLIEEENNRIIVLSIISIPPPKKVFKYLFLKKVRFAHSFHKGHLGELKSKSISSTNPLANLAQENLMLEFRDTFPFLTQIIDSTEKAILKYKVCGFITSYDAPKFHRLAVCVANGMNVRTFLHYHGLPGQAEWEIEGKYCDYVLSWSALVKTTRLGAEKKNIVFKNPHFRIQSILPPTLQRIKSNKILVATSNSPVDYCSCLMTESEDRFVGFLNGLIACGLSENQKFSFYLKTHPSENKDIYRKIINRFDSLSIQIIDNSKAIELEKEGFDFAILLSPSTYMFDILSANIKLLFFDRIMHGLLFYQDHLFKNIKISKSVIKDWRIFFEELLNDPKFLKDEDFMQEQERIKLSCLGEGPTLSFKNVISYPGLSTDA